MFEATRRPGPSSHPRLLSAAMCALLATAMPGQPPPADAERIVDAHLLPALRRALASQQPREVAWGAYRAQRWSLRDTIPELRTALTRTGEPEDEAWVCAQLFLLDALMVLEASLTPAEVRPHLYSRCHAQAVVLALRVRDGREQGLIDFVRDGSHSLDNMGWLACGSDLAQTRPDLLASVVLAQLEVELSIHVVSAGHEVSPRVGGRGGSVGHSTVKPPRGFPPYPCLRLHLEASVGATVLMPGPAPVFMTRTERTAETIHPDVIVSLDRQAVLRDWLDRMAPGSSALLPIRRASTITFSTEAGYRDEVAQLHRSVEADIRRAIQGLETAGLLAPESSVSVRVSTRVTIDDRRLDPEVPLPDVTGR